MTRTNARDLEAFFYGPPLVPKESVWKKRKKWLREYIILGIINTFVVYLVYTPFVFIWVGYTLDQYVRWLQGGIAYSLLTGWFFAFVITKAKKHLFP